MTTLTASTALIVVLGLCTRLGLPRALALGGATPMGAALILGTKVVVPTFYFVCIAAALALALQLLQESRADFPSQRLSIPGLTPLLLFGLWTTAVTVAAPQLFRGVPVLDSQGRPHPIDSSSLLSVSNIAQLGYLILGIAMVVLLARHPATDIWAVGLVLVVSMILSFWRLLFRDFGLPFPEGFFDNSPNFGYVDGAPGGVERFRGIFSEPSLLATVALAAIAFLVAYLPQSAGWRRVAAFTMIGLTVWNAAVSTSATIVVAGIVLLGIALIVNVAKIVLHGQRVAPLAVACGCVAAVVVVLLMPMIADYVQSTIDSKVASSSYSDRSGADNFSYALVPQTFGIGVGLGTNRPSSFLAALASTTGVLGLVLFVAAVVMVVRGVLPDRRTRPVLWAFVSLLICKVISSPDLADPTGLTWLCLGVLAHGALNSQQAIAAAEDRLLRVERRRLERRLTRVAGKAHA